MSIELALQTRLYPTQLRTAIGTLPLNLPPGSVVYSDGAYTEYEIEDDLELTEDIVLKGIRKANAKCQGPPWTDYYKQFTRQRIDTKSCSEP